MVERMRARRRDLHRPHEHARVRPGLAHVQPAARADPQRLRPDPQRGRQQRRRGRRAGAAHAARRRRQRLRRQPAQPRRLEQRLRAAPEHRPGGVERARSLAAVDGRPRPDGAQRSGPRAAPRRAGGLRPARAALARRRSRARPTRPRARLHRRADRLVRRHERRASVRAGRARDLPRRARAPSRTWAAPSRPRTPTSRSTSVWRAWLVLRAWQAGFGLKEVYDNPALRAAHEARSGLRGRERRAAQRVRGVGGFGGPLAVERSRAPLLRALRLLDPAHRAGVPVRRRARLAARDRRTPDGDVPRVDEGGAARHAVGLSRAGGARRLRPAGAADRHPDRRAQSRRARLSRARPRLRRAHAAGSRSIRPRSWDRLSGPCTESCASSP